MSQSLRADLLDGPRRRTAKATLASETVCRNPAKHSLARVSKRTQELSGLNVDEFGIALGYEDGSTVSKWFTGTEPVQAWRIYAVPSLHWPFAMALIECSKTLAFDVTVRRLA